MWDLQNERLTKRWDLHEGLCDSLAFTDPDRLLLIRSETKSGQRGPFSDVNTRVGPLVARIYDLLSPTPTTALLELTDFPKGIHSITLAPGGSAFVVEGVAIENDQLVRRSRVYEGPTGKLLHSLPTRRRPESPPKPLFDQSGKIMGVVLDPHAADAQLSLFDWPALTDRGAIPWPVAGLNPGATRWIAFEHRPMRFVLYERSRAEPLLQVDRDVASSDLSFVFNPDGRYVMAGNSDGTVSVLDLVEINRKLAELHLGW